MDCILVILLIRYPLHVRSDHGQRVLGETCLAARVNCFVLAWHMNIEGRYTSFTTVPFRPSVHDFEILVSEKADKFSFELHKANFNGRDAL